MAALPIHKRIREEIRAAILSGALRPGDKIASEAELMVRYGCSRMTVSKALSVLSAEGLMVRRKRAGSFVARPREELMVLDVPDLASEISARGQVYSFRLEHRQVLDTARARDAAARIGDVGRVLLVRGVHFADGQPIAFEERLINIALVPAIEHADFTTDSPGTWLLRHIPWTEAENRIGAVGASRAHAEALGIAPGAPCLSIERHTWRGRESVTVVRQVFLAGVYELVARFGPPRR